MYFARFVFALIGKRGKMMSTYQDWIDNYRGPIHRQCKAVTVIMQKEFPELRIARGLVKTIENAKWYQHQWLVDENGCIIDPTSCQWAGVIKYKEIEGGDNLFCVKCLNCGEWITGEKISFFCGEKCRAKWE